MRFTYRLSLAVMLALYLIPTRSPADDVVAKFLPSGVTQKVGGYRPIRVEMDKDASSVKVAPEGLTAPKFGSIQIGDKSWAVVLDEPEDKPATLIIDTNSDGDLTNDKPVQWEAQKQGEFTMYRGNGQIDLGDGNLGTLGLYRFDPKDERRAQLKNTLLFYVDYGFEYSFKLDGKPFSTFAAGGPADIQSLPIDRDANGKISHNFERVELGKPFNFTGTTYVLAVNDGHLALTKSPTELPEMPMPPDLSIGKSALPFTATTLNGVEVDFPKHFAGKLVMLDFWATWCGPCIGEIPNMKVAYEQHHDQGFEILGISFDREDMQDKVTEFLKDREMPWDQVYEGKFWETTLGKQYDVSAIPFVLLVDGDSGKILATAQELRGEGLAEFIGEQLKKKKGEAP